MAPKPLEPSHFIFLQNAAKNRQGRKALRDALLATSTMQGLTGTITCDQYGDCADPKIAIYQTAAENVKQGAMPSKPVWKPY